MTSAGTISVDLDVAVTRDETGFLSQHESEEILAAIEKRIMSEAEDKQDTPRPTFHAQPRFEDSVLKLWCDTDYTLAWLKNVVLDISGTSETPLVVKSQSEIKKRAPCKFMIPDKRGHFNKTDIVQILKAHNPKIEFKEWEFLSADKDFSNKYWLVKVTVPEDQIRVLKNGLEFRLPCGMGAVDLRFEDGYYYDDNEQRIVSISGTSETPLVVKSQSEIKKRAPCKFMIPDTRGHFNGKTDIVQILKARNPKIEFKEWEFLSADKAFSNKYWLVKVTVPEDQIRVLKNGVKFRLPFGLGKVDLRFEDGYYYDSA